MGDIVEITSQPHQQVAYYRVSARALTFSVKALHGDAVIGLAKEPGNECKHFFIFGRSGSLSIKGPNGTQSTPGGLLNLLNQDYKRFWIAWDSSTLRVGRDGGILTLSYPNNVTGMNYVVFSTYDSNNPVTWKIELPPESLKIVRNIPYKQVTGGELRWKTAEDQLPDEAVVGGFEGECLYIIRAVHSGSMTPGKFVPSEGVAYVSWGGAANEVPNFEILCGYDFIWVPTNGDKIPVNAYVAGYSEVNHELLYIGRVNHNDCMIPGKVQPSHKVCYVAFGDRELPFKNYEILTVPNQNPHAEGDQFFHNHNICTQGFGERYVIRNIRHEEDDHNDNSSSASGYSIQDEDY